MIRNIGLLVALLLGTQVGTPAPAAQPAVKVKVVNPGALSVPPRPSRSPPRRSRRS